MKINDPQHLSVVYMTPSSPPMIPVYANIIGDGSTPVSGSPGTATYVKAQNGATASAGAGAVRPPPPPSPSVAVAAADPPPRCPSRPSDEAPPTSSIGEQLVAYAGMRVDEMSSELEAVRRRCEQLENELAARDAEELMRAVSGRAEEYPEASRYDSRSTNAFESAPKASSSFARRGGGDDWLARRMRAVHDTRAADIGAGRVGGGALAADGWAGASSPAAAPSPTTTTPATKTSPAFTFFHLAETRKAGTEDRSAPPATGYDTGHDDGTDAGKLESMARRAQEAEDRAAEAEAALEALGDFLLAGGRRGGCVDPGDDSLTPAGIGGDLLTRVRAGLMQTRTASKDSGAEGASSAAGAPAPAPGDAPPTVADAAPAAAMDISTRDMLARWGLTNALDEDGEDGDQARQLSPLHSSSPPGDGQYGAGTKHAVGDGIGVDITRAVESVARLEEAVRRNGAMLERFAAVERDIKSELQEENTTSLHRTASGTQRRGGPGMSAAARDRVREESRLTLGFQETQAGHVKSERGSLGMRAWVEFSESDSSSEDEAYAVDVPRTSASVSRMRSPTSDDSAMTIVAAPRTRHTTGGGVLDSSGNERDVVGRRSGLASDGRREGWRRRASSSTSSDSLLMRPSLSPRPVSGAARRQVESSVDAVGARPAQNSSSVPGVAASPAVASTGPSRSSRHLDSPPMSAGGERRKSFMEVASGLTTKKALLKELAKGLSTSKSAVTRRRSVM